MTPERPPTSRSQHPPPPVSPQSARAPLERGERDEGTRRCGRIVYLSSTEVRLSISVITSAISYFSLCQKSRKDGGVGVWTSSSWTQRHPSPPGARCPEVPPGHHGHGKPILSIDRESGLVSTTPTQEKTELFIPPPLVRMRLGGPLGRSWSKCV